MLKEYLVYLKFRKEEKNMQRIEIQKKCDEILNVISAIHNDENKHELVKRAAESLMERVKKIKKVCDVEKYNICFIGDAGIGKSTAISHLLGLVDDEQLKEDGCIENIPLLKTASGRTTLCSTEILVGDANGIELEIEPLDEEEFNKIVEEFCSDILQDGKSKEKIDTSKEVKRAITNMAGLKISKNWDENCEEYKSYIKEVIGEEVNDEKRDKQLFDAVLKKIDYRNRKNFNFKIEDQEAKKQLKKLLAEINYGKCVDVPYPNKIIIKVNRNDFNLPIYMSSILDTRGLDGEVARDDISKIIDDIHNLCIICDGIATYGNRVTLSPLKEKFPIQEEDLKYRVIVLGLERGYELENVNDAKGRENGKDIKKEEAVDKWKAERICLDNKNMYFYNPLLGIENNGKFVLKKGEDYDSERNSILSNIENFLNNMYNYYDEELKAILSKVNSLRSNKLEERHMCLFSAMRDEVKGQKSQIESKYEILLSELERIIKSIHPATVNASVIRNGDYNNLNIYSQAAQISTTEYDKTLSNIYYHILESNKKMFTKEDDELSATLWEAIKLKVDNFYLECRSDNAKLYKELMIDNIYSDNIWNDLKGLWGSGTGNYRGRISSGLVNRIEEKNVVGEIEKHRNTIRFIEKIVQFLEIK